MHREMGITFTTMTDKNPHIGSTLDDLLDEDGTFAKASAIAIKRVLAW